MSAKHKLNGSYLNGALLIAGAAAFISGSPMVFGVAMCGLIVSGLLSRDLRK